jgi:DNA ligase-1
MEEIIKIVKLLEATGSTNGKIDIIKSNEGNELFKKVLKYTYQDDLQYGFSDKKLRKLLEDNKFNKAENVWADGLDMLDSLANNNINNTLRDLTLTFLSIQTEEVKELWIRILTKDLRCKISSKTINKAIPKLIFDWNVQGGQSFKKVKLKKNEWIALSLKMNGVRGTKYEAGFKSRQNKDMLNLNHILEDIKALGLDEKIVVDGELIRKNIDNIPDNENFRLTCSILNSESEVDKTDIEAKVEVTRKNIVVLGKGLSSGQVKSVFTLKKAANGDWKIADIKNN